LAGATNGGSRNGAAVAGTAPAAPRSTTSNQRRKRARGTIVFIVHLDGGMASLPRSVIVNVYAYNKFQPARNRAPPRAALSSA
jgi:hypothetical protein